MTDTLFALYVLETTLSIEIREINKRVNPLGFTACRNNIDDYDMPNPDDFDDDSDEFTRREMFVRYMMLVQNKLSRILKLPKEQLTECLEPLKGNTSEDEMRRLSKLYL